MAIWGSIRPKIHFLYRQVAPAAVASNSAILPIFHFYFVSNIENVGERKISWQTVDESRTLHSLILFLHHRENHAMLTSLV